MSQIEKEIPPWLSDYDDETTAAALWQLGWQQTTIETALGKSGGYVTHVKGRYLNGDITLPTEVKQQVREQRRQLTKVGLPTSEAKKYIEHLSELDETGLLDSEFPVRGLAEIVEAITAVEDDIEPFEIGALIREIHAVAKETDTSLPELPEHIKELKEKRDGLQIKTGQLSEEIEDLKEEREELQTERDELKDDIGELENLSDLEDHRDALKDDIAVLNELSGAEDALGEYQDLAELRNERQEAEATVRKLRNRQQELENITNSLEDDIKRLEAQKEDLKKEISEREEERERILKEIRESSQHAARSYIASIIQNPENLKGPIKCNQGTGPLDDDDTHEIDPETVVEQLDAENIRELWQEGETEIICPFCHPRPQLTGFLGRELPLINEAADKAPIGTSQIEESVKLTLRLKDFDLAE